MEMKDKRSGLFSTMNGRNKYTKFEDDRGNRGAIFGGSNNNMVSLIILFKAVFVISHLFKTKSILEEQNDQYMIDLEAKVQDLKYISTTMRQQVKESNDLLSSLTDEMGSFGVLLKGTITKIKSLSGTSNWKHIWAMSLFIFFVFLIMYILFKRN
ncbi:hypothetical protein FG386_000625 [Cryptosporidium ryanae]|uniref:uncharacterized protein n=1 Tax=Cryptosporidium ryanae TaxID=515981 RepID=UPI00351A5244|nr:hypothetical protein FG386_000625 [Cryptosporidium ryanae]